MAVYIQDLAEQDNKTTQGKLTRADRRLLLGSSLRVLCRRFCSGKPISHDDVIRVASLTDDAAEHAA